MKKIDKKIVLAVLVGFVLAIVWVVGLRFITYKSDNVHYHANFAMYVNGKPEKFESFTFYEEVQACTTEKDGNPKHRTHMHNQQNDLVHVHADAVTWGHFFSNLGYTLGDKVITTDSGTFADGDKKNKLTFILNGAEVTSIANRVIGSEDRLLVNYGADSDNTLQQRYQAVASNAGEFNGKFDPGGCSGAEQLTAFERLKKALGLSSN